MRALLAALVLSAGSAAAEGLTFVNVATDGASGQHTVSALRSAVLKAEPSAATQMKTSVVLEEPTAHAPPGPMDVIAEVTRLLNEAKGNYSKGKTDGAIEAIAQAEAMAMSTEPLPETFNALAELEKLAGLIAVRQKDGAAADESFRTAFLLKPELVTSESAMGVYARMLKSKDRGTGTLVIQVEPLTAWVTLDGQKSQSGVTAQLEAGTHYLGASREGFAGQLQRVTVVKGKAMPVSIKLVEQSNEPELIAARTQLLEARTDASLALGAKRLSELMKTRYVVLVRPDDAAMFDASTARLSAFQPIDAAVSTITEAVRGRAPPPLVTQAEVKAAEDKRAAEVEASKPVDWYKRPVVLVAGGGAAVVVIGVVVGVVIAATRPPTYRYSVTSWCHASDCPPSM